MIPVTIYICKKCKKDGIDSLLQGVEINEQAFFIRGLFCLNCMTFYITKGEIDVSLFKDVEGLGNVSFTKLNPEDMS